MLAPMIGRLEAAIARWLTPRRCELYPATIAIVLTVGYVVSQAIGPGITDASRTIVGADFSAFWIGGRLLREGRAGELYSFDAQQRMLEQLIAPVAAERVHLFVSPPFFGVAMEPLAALPYVAALGVWWAAGIALLVALCAWARHALPGWSGPSLGRVVATAAMFFPTLAWFFFGQSSVLWLALLTGWLGGMRRGRDGAAGLALGMLWLKPQLALGPVIVCVVARRWRVLAAAVVPVIAWTALGWLAAPDAMRAYAEVAPRLFDLLRQEDYRSFGIVSAFGVGTLLFDGVSRTLGSVAGYGLTAAAAIAIAAAWWRAEWRPGTRAWDLRIAATIAMGLVASPHLFVYDAMLLLLPLAIVVGRVGGVAGRVLDGGPILARTGVLYVALFAGPYAAGAIVDGLRGVGLPGVALQVATIAIVWWALGVWREAARRDGDVEEQGAGDRGEARERDGGLAA